MPNSMSTRNTASQSTLYFDFSDNHLCFCLSKLRDGQLKQQVPITQLSFQEIQLGSKRRKLYAKHQKEGKWPAGKIRSVLWNN